MKVHTKNKVNTSMRSKVILFFRFFFFWWVGPKSVPSFIDPLLKITKLWKFEIFSISLYLGWSGWTAK